MRPEPVRHQVVEAGQVSVAKPFTLHSSLFILSPRATDKSSGDWDSKP